MALEQAMVPAPQQSGGVLKKLGGLGSVIGGLTGAAIGGAATGGSGAMTGFSVGSTVGGAAGAATQALAPSPSTGPNGAIQTLSTADRAMTDPQNTLAALNEAKQALAASSERTRAAYEPFLNAAINKVG